MGGWKTLMKPCDMLKLNFQKQQQDSCLTYSWKTMFIPRLVSQGFAVNISKTTDICLIFLLHNAR